jgi:hypothetical protein
MQRAEFDRGQTSLVLPISLTPRQANRSFTPTECHSFDRLIWGSQRRLRAVTVFSVRCSCGAVSAKCLTVLGAGACNSYRVQGIKSPMGRGYRA